MDAATTCWAPAQWRRPVAVKEYLQDMGPGHGTVIFFGCPGEEGGAAKVLLWPATTSLTGLDIALTWHPGEHQPASQSGSCNSCIQTEYTLHRHRLPRRRFSPELGRSALDAVELMNVGVQFLREHMPAVGPDPLRHHRRGRQLPERRAAARAGAVHGPLRCWPRTYWPCRRGWTRSPRARR